MQDFDIYVVSLMGSPRRDSFSKAADTKLAWRFFDAYDHLHPALSYNPDRAKVIHGRMLKNGELGCFSSHYALWRASAEAERNILVFEDDVRVDWPFFERLAHEAVLLSGLDYLRFFSKKCPPNRAVRSFLDRELVEYLGHPFGTQAYYMSSRMAAKLIGEVREIVRPVDDEMDRAWAHAMPNLALLPAPVLELSSGSQIGQRLPVRQTKAVRLLNLAIRTREKLRKEIYFIRRRFGAKMPSAARRRAVTSA